MIIDVHCHVLPDGYAALEREHGAPPGAGPFPAELSDPGACWERVGADGLAVVSPPPTLFRYDLDGAEAAGYAAALNHGMVAAAAGRTDAAVIGWLPLQSEQDAASEARRLAREPLVVGVAAGTSIGGDTLSSARLASVWEVLAEEELALFVHPNSDALGGSPPGLRPQVLGFPVATTAALLELLISGSRIWDAGVRLCASHGGGFLAPALGRAVHAGAWNEVASLELRLEQVWVDGVLFDERWLEFLHGFLPERHVLPGSDWPFPLSVSTDGLKRQSSLLEPDPLAAVTDWCPRLAGAGRAVATAQNRRSD